MRRFFLQKQHYCSRYEFLVEKKPERDTNSYKFLLRQRFVSMNPPPFRPSIVPQKNHEKSALEVSFIKVYYVDGLYGIVSEVVHKLPQWRSGPN